MTPLERLQAIAQRAGWTLRWRTSPSTSPRLSWTELEIFRGKRAITEGPVAVLASADAEPRMCAAQMVLDALPRRSPPAVAD